MPQVAAHRPRATLGVLTYASASFHPGTAEEERAARGLIATHDTGVIADDDLTVWDVCSNAELITSADPLENRYCSIVDHA